MNSFFANFLLLKNTNTNWEYKKTEHINFAWKSWSWIEVEIDTYSCRAEVLSFTERIGQSNRGAMYNMSYRDQSPGFDDL